MEAWSAERLSDRAQIQEVLYRYCAAIDRIQPDALLRNVFHDDALIDKTGEPYPVGQFVEQVAARHPGVPIATHMITTFLVDFLGDNAAFVESWGLALERHPPVAPHTEAVDRVYRVRYGDLFERRGPIGWRIAKRTFVTDHVLSMIADPGLAPDLGASTRGARDRSDPLVRMRLSLGLSEA